MNENTNMSFFQTSQISKGTTRCCFNYCRMPVEGKLKLKDNNYNPALWLKKKLIGG